ncbi:MAG: kelch repeat-containing protein [Candidatus Hodarchaeota archaeon]
MVYDSVQKRGILFGGYGNYPEIFNDTWSYDVTNNLWTELDSKTNPTKRVGHAMAYDSRSQKVIMFGGAGLDLNKPYNDTWVFNSSENTWINMDALIKEKYNSIPNHSFLLTLGALFCTIYLIERKKMIK